MSHRTPCSYPGPGRARGVRGAAFAAALLVVLPAVAVGQNGATAIGVVDAGRVFQQSQYGLDLLEGLKQLREQKKAEQLAKEKEAQALQDRITQSALALSPERLEELQKELEDKVIALERFKDDAKREIDVASANAMSRFNQQVMPVIDQVGREKGLGLIFNKFEAGLLFADQKLDITDEVIARFDEIAPAEGDSSE